MLRITILILRPSCRVSSGSLPLNEAVQLQKKLPLPRKLWYPHFATVKKLRYDNFDQLE